jgi:hypothetical protein
VAAAVIDREHHALLHFDLAGAQHGLAVQIARVKLVVGGDAADMKRRVKIASHRHDIAREAGLDGPLEQPALDGHRIRRHPVRTVRPILLLIGPAADESQSISLQLVGCVVFRPPFADILVDAVLSHVLAERLTQPIGQQVHGHSSFVN